MLQDVTALIRKHKDIKLVTNRESYLKTVMKPNFKFAQNRYDDKRIVKKDGISTLAHFCLSPNI